MVKPRLVYISNSTEIGSIYKKREIEEISSYCKENNLNFKVITEKDLDIKRDKKLYKRLKELNDNKN